MEGRGPYRFGIDIEVCESWGVDIPDSRRRELGIPDEETIKRIASGGRS